MNDKSEKDHLGCPRCTAGARDDHDAGCTWKCKHCGTNGDHYCLADVARS